MQVVWEPDVDNLYLSLGSDNLALHVSPERPSGPLTQTSSPSSSPLDHIGFIAASKENVDFMAKRMEQFGVPIVQPIRCHRDGSYSFYIDDPDGNSVQILYEPHITPTGGSDRHGHVAAGEEIAKRL